MPRSEDELISTKSPLLGAITVAQAAGVIKAALADAVPSKLRIVGEISNFSDRTHWFFSIKDEAASLRCVCFASSARRVNFPVRDGMQVIITGRVDFYEAQGSLQIYVDKIEPVGEGALELRYRQLCNELRDLGYFDDARKKKLPLLPRRVAVVTSRSGAALQDVINTASKRWTGCQLFLFDVLVQGAAAAPKIAQAIDALSKHGKSLGIDAIILTRGGGSIEDLWAFNERIVADAIYKCSLPIVAAIGHESDTTIAELVADLRSSTPTQAVMSLIPDAKSLQRQVKVASDRLTTLLKQIGQRHQQRLNTAANHRFFRRPQLMIEENNELVQRAQQRLISSLKQRCALSKPKLEQIQRQLLTATTQRITSQKQRVEALSRQLEAVGPRNVLSRGFTYTLGPDGRVLRSAQQTKSGDAITTVLIDGKVRSIVNDPNQPAMPALTNATQSPRLSKPRKTTKNMVDHPGLFGEEK